MIFSIPTFDAFFITFRACELFTVAIRTDEIIRCVVNIQFIHIELGNILKVFCRVHSLFNYLLLILNNSMIVAICHYTLLQAQIFHCEAGGSKKVSVK